MTEMLLGFLWLLPAEMSQDGVRWEDGGAEAAPEKTGRELWP